MTSVSLLRERPLGYLASEGRRSEIDVLTIERKAFRKRKRFLAENVVGGFLDLGNESFCMIPYEALYKLDLGKDMVDQMSIPVQMYIQGRKVTSYSLIREAGTKLSEEDISSIDNVASLNRGDMVGLVVETFDGISVVGFVKEEGELFLNQAHPNAVFPMEYRTYEIDCSNGKVFNKRIVGYVPLLSSDAVNNRELQIFAVRFYDSLRDEDSPNYYLFPMNGVEYIKYDTSSAQIIIKGNEKHKINALAECIADPHRRLEEGVLVAPIDWSKSGFDDYKEKIYSLPSQDDAIRLGLEFISYMPNEWHVKPSWD